ncbi:hypothetical protein ACFL2V_03585 [Pseudomonadota bacterium]
MLHITLSNDDFETARVPIRGGDSALADGLAALVREFRFDRILELLNSDIQTIL